MIINEENVAWAMEKLNEFVGWENFPKNPRDLEGRARSFLRLVHNKPLRELVYINPHYIAICEREGLEVPKIDWEAKRMDPDQLDADWILDLIRETRDTFPLPVEMREMYSQFIRPATTFGPDK